MMYIYSVCSVLFFFFLVLLKHTKVSGAYCLGIFPNGDDPTTLLGGMFNFLWNMLFLFCN
jgi:hypothetical protein